jgi:hypothetical protein
MGETFSDLPVGAAVQSCPQNQANAITHWVEIELVGEDDKPMPWQQYVILLPDGTEVPGYLDEAGFARVEGFTVSGSCQIRFPNLDQEACSQVATLGAKPQS